MEELFFELMQVSTGRLDCLSRGPEPDEWAALYEMAKCQHVEGICYHGVERLFDFGLRAPQDVSIDWMATAEDIRERNGQATRPSVVARYYDDGLRDLRSREDDAFQSVPKPTIQHVYRLFLQHRLNMRVLMDYGFVLCQTAGKHETLQGGGMTCAIGLRRFAQGVMWVLQTTLALERQHLPYEPLEKEGRFLLGDVLQKASRWDRVGHVLLNYPLGIAGLRA